MALASWRVKLIKRSDGKSAVAAAAYRSAQALYDERTGLTHDYTRKQEVLYTAILAPAGAPEWAYDPYQLWNRGEGAERRGDAQTARDVRIALPRELTQEQNIELSVDFARIFVAQGMIVHVSVHDKGNGNPHSHIMLTMRPLDGDNFSKKRIGIGTKLKSCLSGIKRMNVLQISILNGMDIKSVLISGVMPNRVSSVFLLSILDNLHTSLNNGVFRQSGATLTVVLQSKTKR